ncbi:MAG: GntR family transcriptional regulator [Pseudomonadota bacterium]
MEQTFKPLSREPAYRKVSNAIEEKIRDGTLKVGQVLPTEAELRVQFDVTRATVREGIRLLENAGLVTRGAKKRLFVTVPDTRDVALTASRSLSLQGATFREVWETLEAFYPLAVELATERLSDEVIDELEAIQAKIAKADEESGELIADAMSFIQLIAKGLDNTVMETMIEALNMMSGESLLQVIGNAPNPRARIAGAQREIVEALRQRDKVAARKWMSKAVADFSRLRLIADIDFDEKVVWCDDIYARTTQPS